MPVTACETLTRTRQRAALIAGPDHASRRVRLCHTHVLASRLVNADVDRARVGGSRFLEVDPVEGGSANDYDYVAGDPVNQFDLDGQLCLLGRNKGGKGCRGAGITKNPIAQAVFVGVACATGVGCGAAIAGVAAWNVHNKARAMGGWSQAVRQPKFYVHAGIEVAAAATRLGSLRSLRGASVARVDRYGGVVASSVIRSNSHAIRTSAGRAIVGRNSLILGGAGAASYAGHAAVDAF